MFSFQKPRPEAEKRYSLLVILNDGSEIYRYCSHSPLVIINFGREFRKEFGKGIQRMFVFDNTFGIKIKELKHKNGNKDN